MEINSMFIPTKIIGMLRITYFALILLTWVGVLSFVAVEKSPLRIGSTPPSWTILQGAKNALRKGRFPSVITSKFSFSLVRTELTMVCPNRNAEAANTLEMVASMDGLYPSYSPILRIPLFPMINGNHSLLSKSRWRMKCYPMISKNSNINVNLNHMSSYWYVICCNSAPTILRDSLYSLSPSQDGFKVLSLVAIRLCSRNQMVCIAVSDT